MILASLHSEELFEGLALGRHVAARRLFIFEGFLAAQTISIWVEDIVPAGAVAVMVDNSGGFGACLPVEEWVPDNAR